MDASQLFKAGKLDEAIAAQLPVVKARPTDHGQRLFLFELLVFAGERETDPQLKLGRATDWRGDALVMGVGLKAYLLGEKTVGVLDWRKLEIASF